MDHHFNTEIAEKYGVGEAILLHNMCFWQKKNIANKNNYHDGKYWVYNSIQAYSELFPYYTDRQIRSILKKLEDKGCLYVGRYNKMKIDRTKWYSVSDEIMLIHGIKPNDANCQLQLPKNVNAITQISKCNDINTSLEAREMSNGSAQNVKPIPYINTDKNKDNNIAHFDNASVFSFAEFWEAYGKKKDKFKAEKIYNKLSEQDRGIIKKTIGAYIESTPDIQYRKFPCTYLNSRSWEDEVEEKPKHHTPQQDEIGYGY